MNGVTLDLLQKPHLTGHSYEELLQSEIPLHVYSALLLGSTEGLL